MNAEHAVILAAGRGSRMEEMTQEKPKCMVHLGGKSLFAWQNWSLKNAGIQHIQVVTGYCASAFPPETKQCFNSRWMDTNMVSSMLCAAETLRRHCTIISYADIVYHPEIIQSLQAENADIAMVCDEDWHSLWSLRFDEPLDDAESFLAENGVLMDIGRKVSSLDEIQGQYMGLLKFSPTGFETIERSLRSLSTREVDRLDMTSLLRKLLCEGVNIRVVKAKGRWCEVDSTSDHQMVVEQLAKNVKWSHDWR